MQKKRVENIENLHIPPVFNGYISNAPLFDSSCSNAARVYFIDKDNGYYLKTAAKGSLKRQAEMTAFFSSKGMAPKILAYESELNDWLLTERAAGEDCVFRDYLGDPKRLCDTLAEIMRSLHDSSSAGCPNMDRTAEYLDTVRRNYEAGIYSGQELEEKYHIKNAREAIELVEQNSRYFGRDTLIHGDFCLPNIMLDNWHFSGFIDLDNAGVSDRHIDIYWVLWSLEYNLKTDAFNTRFTDAYGKELINRDMLAVIAAAEAFG